MDKSTPQTHPPDDWINPGPITDADRIASYQRDRARDRKLIAELEAQLAEARELLASATAVCGIDDEWWLPRRDALLKEVSDEGR